MGLLVRRAVDLLFGMRCMHAINGFVSLLYTRFMVVKAYKTSMRSSAVLSTAGNRRSLGRGCACSAVWQYHRGWREDKFGALYTFF